MRLFTTLILRFVKKGLQAFTPVTLLVRHGL